jgi:hypothetical protein
MGIDDYLPPWTMDFNRTSDTGGIGGHIFLPPVLAPGRIGYGFVLGRFGARLYLDRLADFGYPVDLGIDHFARNVIMFGVTP